MLPRARDYQRVKRELERTLARRGVTGDEVIEAILDDAADLLGIVGSCWHHTDPDSGLPTASAVLGEPAGTLEWSLVYEFRRPDVSRFEDLRARRSPVAAISAETRGRPRASARFREMIEPMGPEDEVRIAFADPFGLWAALAIFTARRMTEDDLEFLSELLPSATAALRRAAAARALDGGDPGVRAGEDDGPAVLILNGDDRLLMADAVARRRLALIPEPRPVELPGLISFVSAQARWAQSGRSATARMRGDDGRWFLVNASLLDAGGAGEVAVVMQPAPPLAVLDGALRAFGLTGRERQVAALVLRGQSAKAIASSLVISPWTVQDHMKAIYEKTGVGTRGELIALCPPDQSSRFSTTSLARDH